MKKRKRKGSTNTFKANGKVVINQDNIMYTVQNSFMLHIASKEINIYKIKGTRGICEIILPV